jgi:predicted DNA-binding transcriptional regulator YafY
MRADRLVAILLLLQRRGQVTAGEVASELEVSERTARRDLEALGIAGLPVYSTQGRGGGWRLAGGGRTDLSGLTAAEARALFLVAGPSSSATPEVKAALRKLIRALPESFRAAAEMATTSIVVDPHGWDGGPERPLPAHLDEVQRAVVEGERVALGYRARDGAETDRLADPLGLAAKGRFWYLVAGTDAGLRTFRVDRITTVAPTGDAVVRPDGFELAHAWRLIADEVDHRRTPVTAILWATVDIVPWLRGVIGRRLRIGGTGPDGRVAVELRGHSARSIAGEIAGFGAAVEAVAPRELRELLGQIGADLVSAYGGKSGPHLPSGDDVLG